VLVDVLIVEDNEVNQQVLMSMFKRIPVGKVSVVGEGASALEWLLQRGKQKDLSETPVLVCLDLSMPVLGGIFTTKIWRQLEAGLEMRKAYIAVLTGGERKDVVDAEIEVDAFLSKPFSFSNVEAIVKQAAN